MRTNGWNKLYGLAHWMVLEPAGANACVLAISFPIAQASAINFFAHNPNFCVLIYFFCNGLHTRKYALWEIYILCVWIFEIEMKVILSERCSRGPADVLCRCAKPLVHFSCFSGSKWTVPSTRCLLDVLLLTNFVQFVTQYGVVRDL